MRKDAELIRNLSTCKLLRVFDTPSLPRIVYPTLRVWGYYDIVPLARYEEPSRRSSIASDTVQRHSSCRRHVILVTPHGTHFVRFVWGMRPMRVYQRVGDTQLRTPPPHSTSRCVIRIRVHHPSHRLHHRLALH